MEELKTISITEITPNPYQPRVYFDEQQLEELAASIKENGLIQPIIVRKSSVIGYELLAGERRFRACQLLGMDSIPVIVRNLSDDEMLYQAIIENLQRHDLNPIEEAKSYKKLIEKGLTHDTIAKIIGKSRPYITNSLRLLQLSPRLLASLEDGEISQGHARLLISYPPEIQEKWLNKIIKNDLSVRSLEKLLKNKETKKTKTPNLFIKEEEKKLRQLLGTDVEIVHSKKGSGKVTIHFSNIEEFERIIHIFK